MHGVTALALPYTDCQILYKWVFKSTTRTGLTAGIHGRHFYHIVPIPLRFIYQHIKKLTPRYGTDMLCQFMISHHISYFQFLNTDGLVFTYQYRRLFLQEIISLVCDLFMDQGNFLRCLSRLFEPFCFRDNLRCSRMSLCIDLSKYLGLLNTLPLLSE